jgi:hypothetical protein
MSKKQYCILFPFSKGAYYFTLYAYFSGKEGREDSIDPFLVLFILYCSSLFVGGLWFDLGVSCLQTMHTP